MSFARMKPKDKIKDYELDDKLGEGGFATVWRAIRLKDGVTVAIKKICKKKMQACGALKRVTDEVSIHSRLKHKHVLEVLDVFEDKDFVYMVLELCENGTIANYLKTHKCTEAEARRIFSEIVDGVIYLHSHNILHRDLTLGNILLTKHNEVKIADFGLATMLKRPDEKHLTMCGTPNFISPEVATRSSHGLEADVWSLGCMLYALLVGHPPFDTDTPRSTLTRVVMGEYEMPSHLSADAKDLVMQLLKKNPHDRIKLHEIPKHRFLLNHNFLEKWQFPKESNDSGMCTMTTEGTHSLHQAKIMDQGYKRIPSSTVASILNECSVPAIDLRRSHPNHDLYSPSSDKYSSPKPATVDSGEESEADEHLSVMYEQKRPVHPIRLRSRSEDRGHSMRHQGNGYLRSKMSGCEPGEYASLPSKHQYHHCHAEEKSFYPASRHKNVHHAKNNGISTCSADCTSDVNCRPQIMTRSLGHRPASICESLLCDELKSGAPSKCPSFSHKSETGAVTKVGDESACSPCDTTPRSLKSHTSEKCCKSQCSASCCTPQEYLKKKIGKSASCSHLSPKQSHLSEEKAGNNEFIPKGSSPSLDRRRSLDHQKSTFMKDSFSLQEIGHMLFSQNKQLNEHEHDGSSGLRFQAPPLNTIRLLPTRHRTKNAILSILESGEVVIEFLKKQRPSFEENVVDVCRISGDGLRIVLYELNRGKGCPVKDKPPDLPEQGTDAMYSYESLPEKHWKKYKYAVRFVNLVRAKTPKVTLYTDKAKSHLMENFRVPDFESCFYQGGKVSRTSEGLRLIDIEGHNYLIAQGDQVNSLPDHAQILWEHFVQCFQHCLTLERCLSRLVESSAVSCRTPCVFPVIVGRRPVTGMTVLREKENIENGYVQLSPAPVISPNTPMLKSFDISTVKSPPQLSKFSQNLGFGEQNTPLSSRSKKHSLKMKHSDLHAGVRRVNVSGVGVATQLPSGEVRIAYKDGSQLAVHAANNGISFYQSDATLVFRCDQNDPVPDWLRDRLAEVPRIIQRLMETSPHTEDIVQQDVYKSRVRSLR